jgi:flagellin
VGAGNDANDRIAISIGSAKVSALGIGSNSSYSIALTPGGTVPTGALTAGSLSINGAQIGASVTDGVSYADAEGSAIAKAAAINAASGLTGVTAKVGKTTITSAAPTATATISAGAVIINGVDIGEIGATTSAIDRGTQIAAAINAKSSQTGVTATSNTAGSAGDLGKVTLTAADGRNIVIKSTTGGIAGSGLGETADVAKTTTTTITLSTNSSNGIVIGGTDGALATGQAVGFQASVLSSSGGVDLSTAAGSQAALSVLDDAINTVTDSRASMGAYQNRLTASVANLEVTSMNLQASRSRILDTDYAKETTQLAKSQIIQQAATAMLAQANQSAQSVLSLLK